MSIKYALTKQKKKSNTVPIQQGQCDIQLSYQFLSNWHFFTMQLLLKRNVGMRCNRVQIWYHRSYTGIKKMHRAKPENLCILSCKISGCSNRKLPLSLPVFLLSIYTKEMVSHSICICNILIHLFLISGNAFIVMKIIHGDSNIEKGYLAHFFS